MESTLLITIICYWISYITNKILDLKNEIQHCKIVILRNTNQISDLYTLLKMKMKICIIFNILSLFPLYVELFMGYSTLNYSWLFLLFDFK